MLLLCSLKGMSQECPTLLFPQDGDTNVPVDGVIRWTDTDSELVTSWAVSVGTTPNGEEFASREGTGRNNEYRLPCGIPGNTQLYVDLYIFTLTQGFILCESFSFTTETLTTPPECSSLTLPEDGSENVFVGTDLIWECSTGATGYNLSVGTAPGTYNIVPNAVLDAGELSYDFLDDLPPNQDIYVRLVPFNENGQATCEEQRFRTGDLIELPECSFMLSPPNGAQNVELNTVLTWNAVDDATGYRVSIGTSPQENDVLDNGVFSTNTTGITQLEPNTVYYIQIIPFNEAGNAQGCFLQESFSTILGCGPYLDQEGNTVDLRPPLDFPDAIGFCGTGEESTLTATDPADGYRWFSVPPSGPEVLLAEGPQFEVPDEGDYRLEIYNILNDPNDPDITFECSNSQEFSVSQSEQAVIEDTDVQLGVGVISIEVTVSGIGDYEFALDDPEGPFQDSNRFTNLPIDNYRVYVRDKKGCGISDVLVEPDLTLEGFPKFFTPNGDGVNDLWQFILPPSGVNPIRELYVFDRYGRLLKQVDPLGGWDGTFNGKPMPASDYWFRAVNNSNQEVRGHFTLKR